METHTSIDPEEQSRLTESVVLNLKTAAHDWFRPILVGDQYFRDDLNRVLLL